MSSNKKIFPAGKVVNKLVEYVDFAPTMMVATADMIITPPLFIGDDYHRYIPDF
ncbi:hypothetical protein [Paraglaciecola sp.]|uniref:hypothetical protein n=1 Tax=Paraglaciecola sp. TaxID=1920173 RepID=UPI003EFB0A7C